MDDARHVAVGRAVRGGATDTVVLDVGGSLHRVARSTLLAGPFFAALLAHGDGPVLFVDRDATHFRHVLNHLRGSHVLPEGTQELLELRVEADFYGLEALKGAIDARLRSSPSLARSVEALVGAVRRLA
jgi:hypothetical protein